MMTRVAPHIRGSGQYQLEIVGESHYQPALERIAGPHSYNGVRVPRLAVLYLEPDNPHDPYAVRVDIDGMTVGYLSRENARRMRELLANIRIWGGSWVTADALICGGRFEQYFGVWLDIDYDILPPPRIQPTPHDQGAPTRWGDIDEQPAKPALSAIPPLPAWPEDKAQPTPQAKRVWWRFW